MKTTIEIKDFEITIEEMDGKIMISAMKDGEIIEELEMEAEKGSKMKPSLNGKKMMPFGQEEEEEFEEEEEDEEFEEEDEEEDEEFEDEEDEELEDEEDEFEGEDEEDEEISEPKLESFASFIKRRKR